jgi:Flp pilus assembly protein TadG
MSNPSRSSMLIRRLGGRFASDQRGAVIVMFGLALTVVVMSVGVGIDFMRATNFKTSLQGAVDSAALAGASVYVSDDTASDAQTAATNYMTAATPRLPTNNGVTVATPSTSKQTVSGSVTAYVVTVSATAQVPTSFMSLFVSSIPVSATATAKDKIVTAGIDFNGWTSDAGDGNYIYWYKVPKDGSTPTYNQANIDNGTFNLLFTNMPNPPSVTTSFSIPAAQKIGFAFVNNTAANAPGWSYTNQYGGCSSDRTCSAGHQHVFYSQLANPNGTAYTDSTKYNGGVIKNCSLQANAYTGTAPTGPPSTGSCTTVPATVDPLFAPSCSSLNGQSIHYAWNDLGSTVDDMDYNDGQYNFSCSGGVGNPGVVLTD